MYPYRYKYENIERFAPVMIGPNDIPQIAPNNDVFDDFIGFNYAKTEKNKAEKAVHFFLDDYQFTRLWTHPDAYIALLKQFKCVLSPDFSLYADFPRAMQIYNHYRKHWLAAYWQYHGINVIPTICWSNQNSFEWCFDGEPVGSTVAVSSIGTQKSRQTKKAFLDGYNAMLERLTPETIIFYGKVPSECKGNIVEIKSFQEKFRKECE